MCSPCFSWNLFCLRFLHLTIYKFAFLSNLGSFWLLYFPVPSSYSSPSRTQITHRLLFFFFLIVPKSLRLFFSNIFFFFRLISIHVFTFTDSYVTSILLCHPVNFLFKNNIFFTSKIFTCFSTFLFL